MENFFIISFNPFDVACWVFGSLPGTLFPDSLHFKLLGDIMDKEKLKAWAKAKWEKEKVRRKAEALQRRKAEARIKEKVAVAKYKAKEKYAVKRATATEQHKYKQFKKSLTSTGKQGDFFTQSPYTPRSYYAGTSTKSYTGPRSYYAKPKPRKRKTTTKRKRKKRR